MSSSRNAEITSGSTAFWPKMPLHLAPTQVHCPRICVLPRRNPEAKTGTRQCRHNGERTLGLSWYPQYFCFSVLTGTLQTELLSVSRINFSEAFQILVHLKVVRLFVESVLRYGLPANYTGLVINASKLTYHIHYRSDPSWIFTAGSQVRKEGFQRPSISVRLPSTAFKPKPGQEASSERGLCWRIHFFDGPGVLWLCVIRDSLDCVITPSNSPCLLLLIHMDPHMTIKV